MKKYLLLLIFFALIISDIFAHHAEVHQYIVDQAYLLLKRQCGVIPCMDSFITSIKTGAVHEDEYDMVFGYDDFLIGDNALITISHFWDADNGDTQDNTFGVAWHEFTGTIGPYKNAYVKMNHYAYGGYDYKNQVEIRFKGSNGQWYRSIIVTGQPVMLNLRYSSLDYLAVTNKMTVSMSPSLQIFNETQNTFQSYSGEIILDDISKNSIIWDILGRMCHLLGDMSVPAHAHRDEHAFDPRDAYEDWVASEGNPYNYVNYLNVGNLINPFIDSNPLHFLMYTTQQISDHFGSNGPYEGDGNDIMGGNYSGEEDNYLYPFLVGEGGSGSPMGQPTTMSGPFTPSPYLENIRNNTLRQAIRATAGLLFWFSKRTGLIPSTSGTLAHNEMWFSNSLTNNVFVPTGTTLFIKSGSNINLNTYYIVSTGGNIIVESGSTLENCNIHLKQANEIKGLANSLSILSYALSGQTAEIISSITCYGNNNIPSGVSLKINSGNTLTTTAGSVFTFSNTSSFKIYGTLTAPNTTFDFTTPNGSIQNGIRLEPGSYFNSENTIVKNAWFGVYRNRGVSGVEAYNCQYGIYIYGTAGNGDIVARNKLHQNVVGLAIYNFNGGFNELFDNEIYANSIQGIFSSNSTPEISWNSIYSNTFYGINLYNSSYPCLGNTSLTCGSQNNIYGNGTYDLYNQVSGVLYAINNWWGTTSPLSSKFYSSNGTIIYSPYLYSAVGSQMSNAIITENSNIEIITPLYDKLLLAQDYLRKNRLEDARKVCLDIIENYPDSVISFNALNLIQKTYSSDQQAIAELKSLFKQLFSKKDKKIIYGMAGLMLANMPDEPKLLILEEVSSIYKNESIYDLVLHNKFLYYFNEELNLNKAKEVVKEIDAKFPNSEAANDAHITLGDLNEYRLKPFTKAVETDEILKQFAATNYPNPFNPTTIIEFNLPDNGDTNIKIYDIMGREVITIINEYKQAGTYYNTWEGRDDDGNDVASGIYFYSITHNNQVLSNKMILIR